MPLDVIFWSMSRDVTPGSEETGSGASLSGSDYLFRAAGVSPKCGFARGWEAGAGSQDSRLLQPGLVREPPALLLNYPAARAVRPAGAPPPRERPSRRWESALPASAAVAARPSATAVSAPAPTPRRP